MFPVIVAMLLDELFFLFLKSYMSRVYYSVGITLHFIRYHISLQCFDAVGWAAGRAPACKKTEWWGASMVVCLERGADLHMVQLMPLPRTVSCFTKIQIGFTFLVPAHTGSPRKKGR